MISKTIASVFGGCLVSISIMLNVNYLAPVPFDVKLLIGVLISFPLWVAAMVWGYSSTSGKQAWKKYGFTLLISVSINAFFLLEAK
ncbi:hypothetical protein J3L16_11855 [Alteromonas sp. 5E99-2]|uniref:hypothetical protein n=1 Tax=Alteromonas sp. 5E99-2 TaxID=2817683 RepID=UPI001A99091E|nr:hypothetical protein [Alteromonas sp. 5E99-2]MBO1256377.1 hypothetical protein [Alteromonas sp. 5E99-2]